jgi:hypothetical protein
MTNAFTMMPFPTSSLTSRPTFVSSLTSRLGAEKNSMATQVTGEQLELLMQEWDQPLVVDAYATVGNKMYVKHLDL